MISQNKDAIKDHSVFKGLCVKNPEYYARKYMQPNFYLVEIGEKTKSYVVFEVIGKAFVFHLVNFTRVKTRNMTERFIKNFALPFCRSHGLSTIKARVERLGMAKQLEKLGFCKRKENLYIASVREVENVL